MNNIEKLLSYRSSSSSWLLFPLAILRLARDWKRFAAVAIIFAIPVYFLSYSSPDLAHTRETSFLVARLLLVFCYAFVIAVVFDLVFQHVCDNPYSFLSFLSSLRKALSTAPRLLLTFGGLIMFVLFALALRELAFFLFLVGASLLWSPFFSLFAGYVNPPVIKVPAPFAGAKKRRDADEDSYEDDDDDIPVRKDVGEKEVEIRLVTLGFFDSAQFSFANMGIALYLITFWFLGLILPNAVESAFPENNFGIAHLLYTILFSVQVIVVFSVGAFVFLAAVPDRFFATMPPEDSEKLLSFRSQLMPEIAKVGVLSKKVLVFNAVILVLMIGAFQSITNFAEEKSYLPSGVIVKLDKATLGNNRLVLDLTLSALNKYQWLEPQFFNLRFATITPSGKEVELASTQAGVIANEADDAVVSNADMPTGASRGATSELNSESTGAPKQLGPERSVAVQGGQGVAANVSQSAHQMFYLVPDQIVVAGADGSPLPLDKVKSYDGALKISLVFLGVEKIDGDVLKLYYQQIPVFYRTVLEIHSSELIRTSDIGKDLDAPMSNEPRSNAPMSDATGETVTTIIGR